MYPEKLEAMLSSIKEDTACLSFIREDVSSLKVTSDQMEKDMESLKKANEIMKGKISGLMTKT